MNKRIAKKKLKKVMSIMTHGSKNGVSVIIKNQAYVDKNGKECNPLENPGGRFILLKRPKIQYFRKKKIGFYFGMPDTSLDPDKAFIRHIDTTRKENIFIFGRPSGGRKCDICHNKIKYIAISGDADTGPLLEITTETDFQYSIELGQELVVVPNSNNIFKGKLSFFDDTSLKIRQKTGIEIYIPFEIITHIVDYEIKEEKHRQKKVIYLVVQRR